MPTLLGVQGKYARWPWHTSAKDVTNRATLWPAVVVAGDDTPGDDAAGSGLRDPGHAATPGGTSHSRNAGATSPTTRQNRRSNRGADRNAPRNLQEWLLGAGPRAARCQSRGQTTRTLAARTERSGADGVDNAGIARVGEPCRPCWRARSGSPGSVASVAPGRGRRLSSNGFADGWDDRDARSP